MSLLRLYRYKRFQRPCKFNRFIRGGRLLQPYVIDQNVKIKSERLRNLRNNQQKHQALDHDPLGNLLRDSGNNEDDSNAVLAVCLFTLFLSHIIED